MNNNAVKARFFWESIRSEIVANGVISIVPREERGETWKHATRHWIPIILCPCGGRWIDRPLIDRLAVEDIWGAREKRGYEIVGYADLDYGDRVTRDVIYRGRLLLNWRSRR